MKGLIAVVAFAAAIGFGLTSADAQASKNQEALGVAIVLTPSRSAVLAHGSTAAAVISELASSGMAVGAFGWGDGPSGHMLLYGHVAAEPAPQVPPSPTPPRGNATKLEQRLYQAERKQWLAQRAAILGPWKRREAAAATAWAKGHTGVLAATWPSEGPIDVSREAIGLLRAQKFFEHEGGTPLFVIIGDVSENPPVVPASVLRFDGARIVLAGWTLSSPTTFRNKVARWRGFLMSHGAADVQVLIRGLDNPKNIADALRQSAGSR